MKVYRVFYKFAGTQTSLITRNLTAWGAFSWAVSMLQAGARAHGIEEVR